MLKQNKKPKINNKCDKLYMRNKVIQTEWKKHKNTCTEEKEANEKAQDPSSNFDWETKSSLFFLASDYRIDKKSLSDYKYPLSLAGEFRNGRTSREMYVYVVKKAQKNKTIGILRLGLTTT